MSKLVLKHPILSACAAIAAACLVVMLVFGELTIYAWPLLSVVGFIATVILSYRVFGASPNSSIYRPGANPDDAPR